MAVSLFLYVLGSLLVVFGILIILVAIVRRSFPKAGKTSVKAGGVIIVGPIPIVFGTDKKMVKTILTLSIALTALVLVTLIVSYLLSR